MDSNELFIISIQRSGSNWLHRCLAEHSAISINGEINVSAALLAIDQIRAGDKVAEQKLKSSSSFRQATQEFIKQLMIANLDSGMKAEAGYLADKTAFPSVISLKKKPEQVEYAKILEQYFPKAKKILIVRNSRDVLVSFSEWKKQVIGNLLAPTPHSFRFFIRHLNNWCILHERWLADIDHDPSWLVISYEELKSDFVSTLERVFQFLELEVNKNFMAETKERLYRIDSPVYQKENAERGYGFFRNGAVGEWEDKFSWWHKLIYNLFFKARVENIYKKIQKL